MALTWRVGWPGCWREKSKSDPPGTVHSQPLGWRLAKMRRRPCAVFHRSATLLHLNAFLATERLQLRMIGYAELRGGLIVGSCLGALICPIRWLIQSNDLPRSASSYLFVQSHLNYTGSASGFNPCLVYNLLISSMSTAGFRNATGMGTRPLLVICWQLIIGAHQPSSGL